MSTDQNEPSVSSSGSCAQRETLRVPDHRDKIHCLRVQGYPIEELSRTELECVVYDLLKELNEQQEKLDEWKKTAHRRAGIDVE